MNVAETELKHDVMVILDHVLDRQENCAQSVLNHFLAHLAGNSDGNGVSVDHPEALLEDGTLRLGRGDLLLAVVADRQSLKVLVDHEAGLKVVDVLTLLSGIS